MDPAYELPHTNAIRFSGNDCEVLGIEDKDDDDEEEDDDDEGEDDEDADEDEDLYVSGKRV